MDEAEDQSSLIVSDSIIFSVQQSIAFSGDPISSDINKDGNADLVFIYSYPSIGSVLAMFDLVQKSFVTYELDGTDYYSMPLIDLNVNSWISDIDNNGKLDYIYPKGKNLYVVSLDNAGASVGWPGQQGNIRNTGVLEQPAYFAPANDTVYWANTISLSPYVENIIPEKSIVIIKPGTKIKAHSGASLIVQGTLIAMATEDHPVVFGANINGSAKGYWQGITVSNRGNLSIEHCEIRDAEIGVPTEDNSNVTVIDCTIENNLVGIGAFNSGPYIKANVGFSIYDILGKEAMRADKGFKSSGQYVLEHDMSGLKPGVYYLLVLLDGRQAYTTKIAKC